MKTYKMKLLPQYFNYIKNGTKRLELRPQTMKEQFRTQFAIINKNFAEVFKELFGGGNASLKLEDGFVGEDSEVR